MGKNPGDVRRRAGAPADGRWRWLAAFRDGRPDLPRELGEIAARPAYWDAFGKVTRVLGARQELRLQSLWASDRFSFVRLDALPQTLEIDHSSHHTGLR